jgi:hypothetical protein
VLLIWTIKEEKRTQQTDIVQYINKQTKKKGKVKTNKNREKGDNSSMIINMSLTSWYKIININLQVHIKYLIAKE